MHVASGSDERFSIHAPLEAVVDAVFDDIDLPAASAVLGKARVRADERHRVSQRSIGNVTVHA